jgi:hypothetical protein
VIDVAEWALLVLLLALAVVHREWLAAIWFRVEDPRTVACFRVALGAVLLWHLVEAAPLHEYLYTDIGLTSDKYALKRTPGMWRFMTNLDAHTVEIYMGALWISCAAFTLGLATPITKWLTYALFMATVWRADTMIGDHFFTRLLFPLCFARCGEVYSVDAAWLAWRARRRGAQPDGPRAIPAWPRYLLLIQLAVIIGAPGLTKFGSMWERGDTLYYLFISPRFLPEPLTAPVWELARVFGTNLFRVATWGARAWQILFPLVLVGIVTRHARMLGDSMPAPKRASMIAAAVVFALIGSTLVALAFLLWPNEIGPAKLTVLGLGVVCLVWPLSVRLAHRIPARVRPWLVGRRVWGTGFVIFAGTLACLYIADFTVVILAAVVLLFDGEEIGKLLSHGPRPAQPIMAPQRGVGGRAKRAAVAIFCWWHVTAMLGASLHTNPKRDDPRSSWREHLDAPFLYWTNTTVFTQHHMMFANGAPTRHPQLDISVQQPGAELVWIGDGLDLDDDPRFDEQANIRRELETEERWQFRHARWICRERGLVDGTTLTYWLTPHVLPTPVALARDGVEQARLDAETWTESRVISVNVCPDGKRLK